MNQVANPADTSSVDLLAAGLFATAEQPSSAAGLIPGAPAISLEAGGVLSMGYSQQPKLAVDDQKPARLGS